MKPIYIHSGMAGAPQYANADGNIIGILEACLINGFSLKTATSASASGGVLTLNFASNPSFEALQTVDVAVADVAMVNGQHRVVANTNNQVTIAIPGLPDGAVGSSGAGITIKQAGGGWSKPFSASTKAVFRPPAGNRRYLQVVNAVDANTQARGYAGMTDVNTGTEPFPTVAQWATGLRLRNFSYSDNGAAWWLAVTDKWVVFVLAQNSTPTSYTAGYIIFGELAEQSKVNDQYANLISTFDDTFLERGILGDGVAISAPPTSILASNLSVATEDYLRFLPHVPLMESSSGSYVLRGVLPNMYNMLPYGYANVFSTTYENVAGVQGRIKTIPIAWVGAKYWALAVDEDWA